MFSTTPKETDKTIEKHYFSITLSIFELSGQGLMTFEDEAGDPPWHGYVFLRAVQ